MSSDLSPAKSPSRRDFLHVGTSLALSAVARPALSSARVVDAAPPAAAVATSDLDELAIDDIQKAFESGVQQPPTHGKISRAHSRGR